MEGVRGRGGRTGCEGDGEVEEEEEEVVVYWSCHCVDYFVLSHVRCLVIVCPEVWPYRPDALGSTSNAPTRR